MGALTQTTLTFSPILQVYFEWFLRAVAMGWGPSGRPPLLPRVQLCPGPRVQVCATWRGVWAGLLPGPLPGRGKCWLALHWVGQVWGTLSMYAGGPSCRSGLWQGGLGISVTLKTSPRALLLVCYC